MGNRFETPGDFSWTELMTRDLDGSKKFYSELLGWQLEETPMGGGPGQRYVVIKAGGEAVGGMMAMPKGVPDNVPPHWASYVTVKNVDAVVEKVSGLGGRILVPPTDIPKVGRFAVIADPQGATLSVIAYTEPSM